MMKLESLTHMICPVENKAIVQLLTWVRDLRFSRDPLGEYSAKKVGDPNIKAY